MCNPVCPGIITRGKLKYIFEKIKSNFIQINIYLNVKYILTFLNVLTPEISLIHKKITIFAIYTPSETLEKLRFTLPHFPLLLYFLQHRNMGLQFETN